MTASIPAFDIPALEQLIYQVRGIQAARLVADTNGRIEEVHVVSVPGRNPKQIVRDIESLLYVRGGVKVDHRKVSLVQIAEPIASRPPERVRLQEVTVTGEGDASQVLAVLSLGNQRVQGVGSARPDQPVQLATLAAYAGIHALGHLIGTHGQLHLEHLQVQPLASLEVCIVHLSFQSDDEMEALIGISIVREAVALAAVRAVLDAFNRRLTRLLATGH